jgi:hypothetical protein
MNAICTKNYNSTSYVADPNVRSIIDIITSAQNLENKYNVKILTQEAHLLGLIKSNPGKSLKFYLTSTGLSSRWFYITVEKLINAGLIQKFSCEFDARSKKLR